MTINDKIDKYGIKEITINDKIEDSSIGDCTEKNTYS